MSNGPLIPSILVTRPKEDAEDLITRLESPESKPALGAYAFYNFFKGSRT